MGWLALIAVVLAGVPAAAWLAQDRLVFFPQPLDAPRRMPEGILPLELAADDGSRLRGWIRVADTTPAPTLLYFGGNAEEVSWTLADPRWPRDWSVVAINYRGYGTIEGKPGEAALVADALAIHEAVAARPDIDRSRIVAVGRSLGAGVAVQLAAARPLRGVVLVSPFDSLVELGRTHYPWLPVSALLRHRFDGIDAARAARMPLLTIVAEHDGVVPVERSRALHAAWAGPKAWLSVPASDHDTVGASPLYWRGISEHLDACR
jgi:fermentation-respiration switch protein FrsA (DUF1100 family)